jgi:ribosomal subunit interface protein
VHVPVLALCGTDVDLCSAQVLHERSGAMTVPVQVTFRDIPHSDAVASHVSRRAAKLETFHDRITKCHVVVEAPHRHHKHGKRYHVRIDMHVPGKELVVSKNLDDNKEDLHAAVDDAFGDAERVLEDYAKELKLGQRATQSRPGRGTVTKIFHDRGYGFIGPEHDGGGVEIYFHQNSVLDGRFEKLSIGAKVRYAEEDGDKGPQASTVHVVDPGNSGN